MSEQERSPFASGDTKQLEKAKDLAFKTANLDDIDEALELLNEKMKSITKELALGKINQAQFQAIYSRYREQREIIQRLKDRAPDSDAWQRVAGREGITSILRTQHAAEVSGVVVLYNHGVKLIKKYGDVTLDASFGKTMLATVKPSDTVRAAVTQIDDGRWLNLVSGPLATSVFFYTTEPSAELTKRSKIMHQAFEMLNEDALKSHPLNEADLQFPHGIEFS